MISIENLFQTVHFRYNQQEDLPLVPLFSVRTIRTEGEVSSQEMILGSFSENHAETTYHITGSHECVLVYNPEMIVKIQPQSVEQKLNQLIQENNYEEAIKLLRINP
jgi:hypothetical protein